MSVCDFLAERDVSALSLTNHEHKGQLQNYLFARNVRDSGTFCLLSVAEHGDIERIRTLQNYRGFTPDACTSDGTTALLGAIERRDTKVALELIRIRGDHVNMAKTGTHSVSPLLLATLMRQQEIVCSLLKCDNIEVDRVCGSWGTALHGAVLSRCPHTADILLNDGRVNASQTDGGGMTAFELAIHVGNFDLIEVMHHYGFKLNVADTMLGSAAGKTFHSLFLSGKELDFFVCAASRGHNQLVSELLPRVEREHRQTALLQAAHYGHVETVRLLLQFVQPNFKDLSGHTPEWYAWQGGHFSVARMLRGRG